MRGETSNISKLLKSFILIPTSLQPRLQYLFLTIEQIFYISIINGITFQDFSQQYLSNHLFLMFCLIILCLVRFSLKCGLFSVIGLMFLQILINSSGPLHVINFLILGVLLITEFIDSIALDITSLCIQSELGNLNKVIHFPLILASIFLVSNQSTRLYAHFVSFCFFLMLFLAKDIQLVKKQEYGRLRKSFYIWATLEHLRLFMDHFIEVKSPLFFITGLLISFVVYVSVEACSKKVNFQELFARSEYLKLCFLILKYKFSDNYDEPATDQAIKILINDDEIQGSNHSGQNLFQFIQGLLSKDPKFQSLILLIELNIIQGHFFSAIDRLQKAKRELHWYQFINIIILFKTESLLVQKYEQKSSNITMIYQKQLKMFLSFQNILNKSAKQNLKLCTYLKNNIVQLTILRKMGLKIIQYQKQMHEIYVKTNNFFIASTEYYYSYLVKIKNDYQTAKQILSNYLISQRYLVDFQMNFKMYIKLKLQENFIKIDKVGFNSNELFNYSQKDLQGQQIERLLPTFFREEHQNLCKKFMYKNIEQMCLFQKRTIIRNNKEVYKECNIVLKMNYCINEGIRFEGHIHLVQNENYNLQYFFFLNSSGKILEANSKIFDSVDHTNLNFDDTFGKQQIGSTIIHQFRHEIVAYDPLLVLQNGVEQIYFYARNSQKPRQKSKKGITCKQLEEVHQCQEQKLIRQSHNAQIIELQKKINKRQLIVLFVICGCIIAALLVCSYLLIFASNVKYAHENLVVTCGQNLMQYYNNLYILAIELTYLDLNNSFQYNKQFPSVDLVSVALQLSVFNEHLKIYNRGKYNVSSSPLFIYEQSNFQLVQILISNSYAYRQFQNDSYFKNSFLQNFEDIIFTLMINSFTDYRISVFNLVSSYVQIDNYYNKMALFSFLTTVIILTLFIGRLYLTIRKVQELALIYRCKTIESTKIAEILQFLHQITLDNVQIEKMKVQKQLIDTDTIYAPLTDSIFVKTQTSFMRQLSKRDLMQQTFNKITSGVQIVQANDLPRKAEKSWNAEFRSTKSYRKIMLTYFVFIALLVGLVLGNDILNNNYRDVNETASINSIVTLYRASAFYSRAIIITFNTVHLKMVRNIDITAKYQQQINNYYTYLIQFTIPQFPQAALPEFSQYSSGFNKLNQQSICNYISCKQQYAGQLNLNFMTVINKFSSNLSTFVGKMNNLSSSQFLSFLSSTETSQYIDYLFESQALMRDYTIDLSMTYLNNYEVFMKNSFNSKINFITAIIVVIVIGIALFIYLIAYIKREQSLFIKIVKIYY